jgi:hypothetical protein
MDVETAFLNGVLDPREPPVYIRLPDTYPVPDHLQSVSRKSLVGVLHKGLYGLKQSPRVWNQHVSSTLKKLHFKRGKYDDCLFSRVTDEGVVYILVYVDDLIIAASSTALLNNVKQALKERYKMSDLGPIAYCLGIEISRRPDGSYTMCQQQYIKKLLETHRMHKTTGKRVEAPLPNTVRLTRATQGETGHCTFPYRELVGSLMFLVVCTRGDIAFAVSYLARYMNCYTDAHATAAKHVLKYLKTTIDYGRALRLGDRRRISGLI